MTSIKTATWAWGESGDNRPHAQSEAHLRHTVRVEYSSPHESSGTDSTTWRVGVAFGNSGGTLSGK